MGTSVWLFLILLFVWVVILQAKTSDMRIKIDYLTSKLKKLEKHLGPSAVEKRSVLKKEETAEEPENDEGYIDDTGIIENTLVEEERHEEEQKEAEIKSIDYINNNNDEKTEDFEHVFLGKISYIIGAVAIIIACCIFIGLIQGLLPPMFKAVIALFIGTGMIIGGLNIKKESLLKYSEGLIGTGFAVIFITIYAATMITHTFSYTLCTILGILALISAYIVADKQKTVSMIAIALIGGYFSLYMVTPNITSASMFIYLIFLNILSMAFVIKNTDKYIINYVNIILTFLAAEAYMSSMDETISFVYPVILWLIYQIYDIVLVEKAKNYDEKRYFHWLNYGILSVFSFLIFREDTLKIGLVQFYLTIPYCIFSWYFKSKESPNYRLYLNNLLLCLFPATYFLVQGCARTGIYSLIAIIISIVVNKLDKDYLAKWATGFISVAIISVFILNKDMFYVFNADNYHPIFNLRTLSLLSAILASFVCFFEFNESKSNICKNLSNYMKFCGITLIYILISFEIGDYILYITHGNLSAAFISSMTYAIICSVYSVQMRKLSITSQIDLFRIISYIAGILVLALLLTGGLSYKPIDSFIPVFNIRFIAFITAISVAAYLSKYEKTDLFKYIAVILGFILITVETADYARHIASVNMNYLVSAMWIIYAGIILAIGIFKDKKYLKMSGIWAIILTVCKILFFDMAQVNFLYKMIVFILLGAVLMITSYYYNKLQK
jgi:uncharacterized membrane protein